MSAGSDAHGDFNYADEVTATAVPYSGMLHSNAYARVRTYALVHDRPAGTRDALDALREGNTVLTDGPVFEYQLDADGRHDPDAGAARWHDATSRWENADGRIGGSGRFDGGTHHARAPRPARSVWIRSRWKRSVTPGAGDITRYRFDRVMASARDSFSRGRGARGRAGPASAAAGDGPPGRAGGHRARPGPGRALHREPGVGGAGARRDRGAGGASARRGRAWRFPAGTLKVTFHFPLSMSAEAGTRAFLRPLDSRGNSTDPEIELVSGSRVGGRGRRGRRAVLRGQCRGRARPAGGVGRRLARQREPASQSFVVYLERPADVHGNVLNDVGRAFAVSGPATAPGALDTSSPVRER